MRQLLSTFLRLLLPRCEFGGGGGSQSTNKFTPPDYTTQPWQDYLSSAAALQGNALTPYQGQTVANLTPQTGAGLQMLTDYTTQGTPDQAAAQATLLQQMQGNMNPYATAANPYMGNNPYLQDMVKNSNDLISHNFATGTAANTDAAAARSGAFGGSGWQQTTADNSRTLAGSLAANTNNLLSQNYNQSSGLAENALNRATGAYDTSQGRALQGAQVSQGQQGLDLSSIQALIAGGQIPQQYQQQLLSAAQNLYTQGQQLPYTQLDAYGNALARASGSYGTNTSIGPGASIPMGLLGAGAAAYGLMS